MTQPPDGYPSPDPGRREPRPADPFAAPPSWDQPTQAGQPQPWAGAPPAGYGPPGPRSPYDPPGSRSPGPPGPGSRYDPPGPGSPYGSPSSPPYGPGGSDPPYGPPPAGLPPPPPDPPRRRRRLLLIGALALAAVLLLCAGGGVGAWLLTRDPDRNGADTPVGAVQSFMQAVYRDLDAAAAASVVCSEARDEGSLETKIDEIRTYEETELNPNFSWSEPAVVEQTDQLAILAVTVTMTTDDEKTAQQTLHVSVLDKDSNGWWVCDLHTVEPEPSDGATGEPGDDDGDGG